MFELITCMMLAGRPMPAEPQPAKEWQVERNAMNATIPKRLVIKEFGTYKVS